MSEQLKDCPFCGGAALIEQHEAHSHAGGLAAFMPDYPGSFTLECAGKDCNTGLIADTRAEVIAMWNRRAPASDPRYTELIAMSESVSVDTLRAGLRIAIKALCDIDSAGAAPASEPAVDRDGVLEEAAILCEQSEILFDIEFWMNGTRRELSAETARSLAGLIRARKAAPAAPAVPASPLVASEHLTIGERCVFERACRESKVVDSFAFQLDEDDGYRWGSTRRLFKFWQVARSADLRQTQAESNSPEFDGISVQGAQASPWISVEDRLPEAEGRVLIVFYPYDNQQNERVVASAWYSDGTFFDDSDGDEMHPPSHWMPMLMLPDRAITGNNTSQGDA